MMRCTSTDMMPLNAPTSLEQQRAAGPPQARKEWLETQRVLARSTNLALVTIAPHNQIIGEAANDTSICQTFLQHPEKSRRCAEYCGRAHELATAARETIVYRCHAGLHCFAAPVNPNGQPEKLVVIGGRAFISARDYREFMEREQQIGANSASSLCRNLKFADEAELKQAAQLVLSRAREIFEAAQVNFSSGPSVAAEANVLPLIRPSSANRAKAEETDPRHRTNPQTEIPGPAASVLLPSNTATFFDSPFDQGCREALHTVSSRYGFRSMALLMRRGEQLVACAASGLQRLRLINACVKPGDALLLRMRAQSASPKSLVLSDEEIAFLIDDDELSAAEIGEIFPLFIGTELHGALLVLDARPDAETRHALLEFGQSIIVPLEMTRLRNELNERVQAGVEMRDFTSRITTLSEASQIYSEILRKAVEVLGAERASLLTLDEQSQLLTFRESFGLSEEVIQTEHLRPGEGIAGTVFERGEPLLVPDVNQLAVTAENMWILERVRYKSDTARSFISFPIRIGDRRIGVLNLTGHGYNNADLKWLDSIIPHAAAALDRIHLREQADRFQLMSITDPLTGLVNRRYLDERFAEELKRSQRYYYPLSLLMIDIDAFKSYNDTWGHQAGDEVLRAVAQSIRGSLRNFDVAARYGGEEFCIVLPETDAPAAAVLAERLRAQVAADFGSDNPHIHRAITISIGVASLSHGLHTTRQITQAADEALYKAKNQGRNCVVVYNDPAA